MSDGRTRLMEIDRNPVYREFSDREVRTLRRTLGELRTEAASLNARLELVKLRAAQICEYLDGYGPRPPWLSDFDAVPVETRARTVARDRGLRSEVL